MSVTSPLVGRQVEQQRLERLLRDRQASVIAVRGPAGTGRSALVAAVVPRVGDVFADAAFVDLAGLSRTEALSRAENALSQLPARRTGERERDGLWDPELLLLDHADALAGSAAQVAALATAADATVVAVTRTRWRGPSVQSVTVAPLAEGAALALLRSRALDHGAELPTGRAEELQLQALARASGGSPLVLDLMAARLRRDGTGALLDAVHGQDDVLHALVPVGSPLLEVLSVFGAADVDAAAVVGELAREQVDGLLRPLLQLHLVRIADASLALSDRPAYRLPGLVRKVVRSRLVGGPREQDLLRRHTDHYAQIARRAGQLDADAQDLDSVGVIRGRYLEARAALGRLCGEDRAAALRMATDLLPEAERRGERDIVAARIERLLEDASVPGALRRDALVALVSAERKAPDAVQRAPRILARLDEAMTLLGQAEAEEERLPPLYLESLTLSVLRDYERARRAATEGEQIAASTGRTAWQARFEASLALVWHVLGDQDLAWERVDMAYKRARACQDPRALAFSMLVMARLPARADGGRHDGPTLLRETLAISRQLEDPWLRQMTVGLLATEALRGPDPRAAAPWLVQRYELVARARAGDSLGGQVVLTIALGVRLGHDAVAARLHGSLSPWGELVLVALPPPVTQAYHLAVAAARSRLGDEAFDEHARRGGKLDLELAAAEAADYARGIASGDGAVLQGAATTGAGTLTERERQVLSLIVTGRRNKEIAAQLHLSAKTVMHHTGAIYRKLGVRGRAEATLAAIRDGIVSR